MNMKQITSHILTSLAFLSLAGCATTLQPPPPETSTTSPTSQKTHNPLKKWDINGSLSVDQFEETPAAANTSAKHVITSYRWRQWDTFYQIDLSGSLDLYRVQLVGTPDSVTLWKSNRDYLVARTPEALIQQQTGWNLPISDLHYWVQGLTAPNSDVEALQTDNVGHIVFAIQDGWQVEWLRYTTQNNLDLPSFLRLTRPGWKIKIQIQSWNLTPNSQGSSRGS